MHFICTFFVFLLGMLVHGQFVRIKRQEGVEIKARRGLQSNRNTKRGKKREHLPMTSHTFIQRIIYINTGKCLFLLVKDGQRYFDSM